MDEVKIAVDAVEGVKDPGGTADAELRLRDGTSCLLSRSDERFAARLKFFQEQTGQFLYVECDAQTRQLKAAIPAALRRIESVDGQPEGGSLRVLIRLSPSPHHLQTAHRRYTEMRGLVEEGARTREPLLVTVHPRDGEILDVRRPPEGITGPII